MNYWLYDIRKRELVYGPFFSVDEAKYSLARAFHDTDPVIRDFVWGDIVVVSGDREVVPLGLPAEVLA